jgi:hypothetical protein
MAIQEHPKRNKQTRIDISTFIANVSESGILLWLAHDKAKQSPEHRLLGVEMVERQSCREPSEGARAHRDGDARESVRR